MRPSGRRWRSRSCRRPGRARSRLMSSPASWPQPWTRSWRSSDPMAVTNDQLTAAAGTTPTAGAATPRGRTVFLRDAFWGYLMIAPIEIGLAIFYLYPIVRTFYFSFTEWGAFGGYTWTGLENYRELVADEAVRGALLNTLLYSFLVLLGIPLSIALAALLNVKGLRGVGIYRVLYFLPVVTMPIAVAIVWRWIYNGDF